jgi:hypothetical protein
MFEGFSLAMEFQILDLIAAADQTLREFAGEVR